MSFLDIPIPKRMQSRPRDSRGYTITYVTLIDKVTGKPDFKVLDQNRVQECMIDHLCGLCGQPLKGETLVAFIGGEKSVQTRLFSDPAMHFDCAEYATKVCPYLCNPNSKHHGAKPHEGIHLITNPLVADGQRPARMAIYLTRGYEIVKVRIKNGPYHEVIKARKAEKLIWF